MKRGGEGVVVLGDDDVPVMIPARKVMVADTTAAGDAFNGAFAVAAAGISVTRQGAQPAMARRAEIDAVMALG